MAKIKPLPNGKKTLIKKRNNGRTIGIIIGVAIVLLVLGFLVKTEILDKTGKQNTDDSNTQPTQTTGLAAMVGSEKITMQDLDQAYASIPDIYQGQISKAEILQQLIDEKLLIIDAKRKGITVPDKEVQDEITRLIATSNITDQEFEQALQEQGVTKEEFMTAFKTRLLIAKLFNVTILSTAIVTEEDTQNYYDENEQLFIEPPSVRASHILVETEDEANGILDQLKAGEDFATLAKEKSIDPSAAQNGGDLGYFSNGMMVPEFEQAAFALSVGEYSEPVQTDFGWHIISVTDKKNGRQVAFDEVKDQLIESLKTAKAREEFTTYLSDLENKTQVVIYYKEEAASQPITLPDNTEQTEQNLVPLEEATEEPEQMEEPESPSMPADTFTACLNSKGVVLFGTYWNKDTQDQLAVFGSEKDDLRYVECGVEGDYATETKACKDEKILGYPTWKINDELMPGILTKEKLSDLTGC
ncbi:MAG: peptidylprolyl isomerase [Nanoarchaeota archaeon]